MLLHCGDPLRGGGHLEVKRRSWHDLFHPGIRRALVVGFVLAILVHLSGINTIIDYAPAILRSAGPVVFTPCVHFADVHLSQL
jgi:hypothetical protein